ncbi:MAG: hypothetical protein U5K30_09705 [Acidimicrobiales bacterium]|nr:hypothetical protein [Acidimicrobiales bacterium]
MVDLLLPRTDGGVLLQVVVAVVFFTVVGFSVRRNRDLLVFVSGLAAITAAWLALRTVH